MSAPSGSCSICLPFSAVLAMFRATINGIVLHFPKSNAFTKPPIIISSSPRLASRSGRGKFKSLKRTSTQVEAQAFVGGPLAFLRLLENTAKFTPHLFERPMEHVCHPSACPHKSRCFTQRSTLPNQRRLLSGSYRRALLSYALFAGCRKTTGDCRAGHV